MVIFERKMVLHWESKLLFINTIDLFNGKLAVVKLYCWNKQVNLQTIN
jgi:hypothetical protein